MKLLKIFLALVLLSGCSESPKVQRIKKLRLECSYTKDVANGLIKAAPPYDKCQIYPYASGCPCEKILYNPIPKCVVGARMGKNYRCFIKDEGY